MIKTLFFLFISLFALAQIPLSVPVDEKYDNNYAGSREWRAPNYNGQEQALGWTKDIFEIPNAIEREVRFWINIYTRYSTDQGVIHNTDRVYITFEDIDFASITNSPILSSFQKAKAREKMIELAKQRALELLKKLEMAKSDEGLSEKELKVWNLFKDDKDPDKFKKAQEEGRLRFQLGQADRMQEAIFISGRYLEKFEQIFRERGLPIELTRLPFVESSFNVFARSKVGASGLWQVMRTTGRGRLKINQSIDLRNHPIEASQLAARILRDNFNMLESWPLAVTGYNHGPTGVRRVTEKNQTRDISELIKLSEKGQAFGFASRNFFPSFLAAIHVEKNAATYFPMVRWSNPLDHLEIELKKPIKWGQMVKWFEEDDRKAQLYNPHIMSLPRKGKLAIPPGTVISVPSDKYMAVLVELGQAKPPNRTGTP